MDTDTMDSVEPKKLKTVAFRSMSHLTICSIGLEIHPLYLMCLLMIQIERQGAGGIGDAGFQDDYNE
jgi:hypothetical protein